MNTAVTIELMGIRSIRCPVCDREPEVTLQASPDFTRNKLHVSCCGIHTDAEGWKKLHEATKIKVTVEDVEESVYPFMAGIAGALGIETGWDEKKQAWLERTTRTMAERVHKQFTKKGSRR